MNQDADSRKPFDVALFLGEQWVLAEMATHTSHQIPHVSHFKFQRLVRTVRADVTTLPQLLDRVKQLGAVRVLAHRKTGTNFPAELVSIARLKRNAEAAFAVYEARDVRREIHRQRSGPACYGVVNSIQGSQPLSRYGDRVATILPSVLPATHLRVSGGLHRFEPDD